MLTPDTVSSSGSLFHIRFQICHALTSVVENPCVSRLDLHRSMPISLKTPCVLTSSLVWDGGVTVLDLCTTQISDTNATIADPRR